MPAALYRKMGVDVENLRSILHYKLIMDDRRPNSIHQTRQAKQKKPISFSTLGLMLFSAFLGIFFLVSFAVGKDMVTSLAFYFSFYIFILASTLIADFTSVLIDVRDNMIILPKPISDKTFVLARLLHILIHVTKIVLPMTIPGMIYLGVQKGVLGCLSFILLVIAATLFTIFLINAVYIFILKITTPQKFKTIISYFQIVFAIFFYGGYQLVPRLISKSALSHYSIETVAWRWLIPPYWFAESWQFIYGGVFSISLITGFLLSLIIPLISIWVVIKYFAPSFNQKLSMISGSEGGEVSVATRAKNEMEGTTPAYLQKIALWLTMRGAERMSFLYTWKMMGRSRDFKMKVYPSFGYLLVFIVIQFMNSQKLSINDIQQQTGGGKIIFISVLYFSGFMLIMALNQMVFSDKYKASWIYYITPIASPGTIISGAVKSILTKFFIPIVLFLTIVGVSLVGPSILPNLILGMCNQVLVITCIAYITIKDLPFSIQQSMQQKTGSFIRGLFSLIIPGILAFLHYTVYSYLWVILLLIALSAIACWLVMDGIQQKSWDSIKVRNHE
jgi:hypothetical protein